MTQDIRHELRAVEREINDVPFKDVVIRNIETGNEDIISAMTMGMTGAGYFEHVLAQEIGEEGVNALYNKGAKRPINQEGVNRIWAGYSDACSCE